MRCTCWISSVVFVSSPGNTIKGPINFQPEDWRSFSTPLSLLSPCTRWQSFDVTAEVNEAMHHQNTPGQLEVKCCVVSCSPVDKPAVNIWTFPLFFFFFLITVKSHNDTRTSNGAFHSKLFLFIESAVAFHSSCLQWQIPSQTWKWSKLSKPLWNADNLRSKLTPSWVSLHF